jgi:hypothetical protein
MPAGRLFASIPDTVYSYLKPIHTSGPGRSGLGLEVGR